MKSFLKIALAFTALFYLSFNTVQAQNKDITYMPEGRFLVIGSFNIKRNAIGYTDYVKKMGKYDVKMAYHPIKKFYYVYIKGYAKNESGANDVNQMRKETEFVDTWYMVVKPYDIPTKIASKPETPKEHTPVTTVEPEKTDTNIEEPANNSGGWIRAASPGVEETIEDSPDSIMVAETGAITSGESTAGTLILSQPKLVPKTYVEKGKYKLFFNSYYTRNFKEIKGPVEIINPKTLKLLRVAQSQELVRIADPNNGEHSVQLIANIFGYKKVQHDIKLNEPFNEVNEEFFYFKGDTLIADFPLRRYDMGEIATMYNVFFFKDAAIMKPISKFELNSLLDMLKENDELRIKIHGHTNGNERGKIITMMDGSDKYFTLTQELEEDFGTAKELSLARAEIIKKYLISYGINENRMEVIGWGGKKPIYDKMDKLAVKNVRVEIEIIEN